MFVLASTLWFSGMFLAMPYRVCDTADACIAKCAPPAQIVDMDEEPVIKDAAPGQVPSDPNTETRDCLFHLGRLGEGARPVAARVAEYLHVPDRMVRVRAAWVLGRMRARSQGKSLRSALNDREWRVVAEAVRSLVKLQDPDNVPALRRQAASHWYPVIRDLANRAIAAIESHHPDALDPLFQVGRGASDMQPLSMEYNPFSHIPARSGRPGRIRSPFRCTSPTYARAAVSEQTVAWAGGYLEGAYQGEFIGHLDWIVGQRRQRMARVNVVHMQVMRNGRAWVMVGYAHMGSDHGALLQLERSSKRAPQIEYLLSLPGSPRILQSSPDGITFRTATGDYRIEPVLSPQGFSIRYVPCVH